MRRLLLVLAGVCLPVAGACSSPTKSPYLAEEREERDTARAERLSREGARLIDSAPADAEQLLRQALAADLFFGPAHNNLGVLFLKSGELYDAANEFEWARKLMPGHPDPRLNLALTLETAGQNEEAMAAYESALEVYPEHIAAVQGLVRLQLRLGKHSEDLTEMLQLISMRGETPGWRTWASRKLLDGG